MWTYCVNYGDAWDNNHQYARVDFATEEEAHQALRAILQLIHRDNWRQSSSHHYDFIRRYGTWNAGYVEHSSRRDQ